MVLYLIGLGLCDEKNITLRGLEYIKSSDYIYMEYYTSILSVDKSKLESLYEKPIILADREMIESNFDSEILSKVKEHKVSDIIKGKKIYERSKFISVNEGLNELIETSEKCEK